MVQKLVFAFLLSFLIYFAFKTLPLDLWALQLGEWIARAGLQGLILFFLVYNVATVSLIPCAFLSFAAGLAYGLWGIPLVILSASSGAALAFLVSRHFVRKQVDALMNKRPVTKALRKAIEMEGWKFMFLLRISPLVPFNLNNYFLGTVPVHFSTYLWVTAAGSIPGTFLFVYLGSLGKEFHDARGIQWTLFAVGVLATAILARFTLKKTRDILRQNTI